MSKIESKIRKERVIERAHDGWFGVFCVTSTKDYVITGGDGYEVILWEKGGKGQKVRTFKGHEFEAAVQCLDTTPDGKYLVTGSTDKTLILWEISSGNIVRSFKGGHTRWVWAVAVTPSGDGIVSGSRDNTAILWNLHDGSILHTFKGHSNGVLCVCIDSTGKFLYTGGDDKIAIKWDLKSGKRIMTYSGHSDYVLSISLASDKYLVTGSADKTAIVWNVDDATPLRTFKGQHSDWIWSICLSPDLRFLASCSDDNTTVLWDFHTTQPLHTFKDHTDAVNAVHITAENRLITGSFDNNVIQYDISTLCKDISARFALLHCLRTISHREEDKDGSRRLLHLDSSASRAYRTRDISSVRYLMCCACHTL